MREYELTNQGWDATDNTQAGKIWRLERQLKKCKELDITVVIAAGNEGTSRALDDLVPQRFGTDDKFDIITVGAVDKEGRYWAKTVNSRGNGGQIDLYAGGVQVTCASHDGTEQSTVVKDGTSLAAPAVVINSPFHPRHCGDMRKIG